MLRENKKITFNDKDINIKTLGFYQFSKLVTLFVEVGKLLGIDSTGLNRGQYFKKVTKEFSNFVEDDLTGAFSDNTVITLIEEIFTECFVDLSFRELTIEAVFALLYELTNQSKQ